jgi:1-acyl-sn-glycerol-3-phosphate acyltransferase
VLEDKHIISFTMIFMRESRKRFLAVLLTCCALNSFFQHRHVSAFSNTRRLARSQTKATKVSPTTTPTTKTRTILFSKPTSQEVAATAPLNEGPSIGYTSTCLLPPSEINPIITLKKGQPKEKIINPFGLYSILITIILNPIWSLAMFITDAVCNAFPDLDPSRAFYDYTGKIWSRAWLTIADSYPTISGDVERLEDNGLGACLFVANHASWLDIPVLCTVLDPVFKFIAKGELKAIPCIGQQLVGVSGTK